MSIVSKVSLTLFEIVNELYTAIGGGVAGIVVLIKHGYETNHLLRTLCVTSVTVGSLFYVFHATAARIRPSSNQIVFISGCDSGLGFSLAIHAHKLGFTVIAGCLNLDSPGARELKHRHKKIKQIQLDVTDYDSIYVAVETINQYLNTNRHYEFYALINNAAVMIFGEFEWQTERLIHQQLQVNLGGTLNLSKAFIPLLRKYKGRIMNITSHCSVACLPGLSVYGATKAGIKAFSDGLRVELEKYGVNVIMFTPGSFVTESNIMARHADHVKEMYNAFTKEQHVFYDDYFQRYNTHLLGITTPRIPKEINNINLYQQFEDAMLLESPKASYKIEPPRYAFYHWLFKLSPTFLRDYFVVKFMSMPQYNITQIL